jgi:hypothetical protein
MWFATIAGVAMVDPGNLSIITDPPPVVVEAIYAGQEEFPLRNGITIPPDQRDIGIDFTAMGFSAPTRIRFRYMLEGYNESWVDASSRRWAFYSNLDPGHYRFRVTAANADGPWNTREAVIIFELAPFFYETRWFQASCLLLLLLVSLRGFQLYRRYQHRKLIASQLETELSKAQLQALRLQLQPHFLFNTLNAISGTILVSRDKGIKMIAKLSELLRQTLEMDATQILPLRREIALLKPYLDLERERFGNRLSIRIDVPDETLDASVPSFILQPLVENAIHHGTSRTIGRGTIFIQARKKGVHLELVVADNGANKDHDPTVPSGNGIGLSNTRNRLKRLYGDSAELALYRNDSGGMTSRIVIPFSMNGTKA